MKKTYTWPSEEELKRVMPILEKAEGRLILMLRL